MNTQFYKDLTANRYAEYLVCTELEKLTKDYTFTHVGEQPQYYHIGDIIAEAADGTQYFIEVKNDSRIADTHNVLCEHKVYYYGDNNNPGYYVDGNMMNEGTTAYCVHSAKERKIYILDFNILKENYLKHGRRKDIYHAAQMSITFLLPLSKAKELGALIAIVEY